MNRRIAKKILNPDGFHWDWYRNDNALISLAPRIAPLYYKACRTLHREPYYNPRWMKRIARFRKTNPV